MQFCDSNAPLEPMPLTDDGLVLFDVFFKGVAVAAHVPNSVAVRAIDAALKAPDRPDFDGGGPLHPAIAVVLTSTAERWQLPTRYLPLYVATRDPVRHPPEERAVIVDYQALVEQMLGAYAADGLVIHPKAGRVRLRAARRELVSQRKGGHDVR